MAELWFEKILASNLINFIIMIWILSAIFKKFKLGGLIDNMAQNVRKKIEESKKNAQNALEEYEKVKDSVKNVEETQNTIIKEAKDTAKALEKNIERETQLASKELEESYNALSESYRFKAKRQTLEQVYSACVALAQEQVQQSLDAETHKHLINKAIDDLSKMDGMCL